MRLAITGINARMGLLTLARLLIEGKVEHVKGLDVLEPEKIMQELRQIIKDQQAEQKLIGDIDMLISRVTIIKGDVRNPEDVKPLLEGCDMLIHLAFIVFPIQKYNRNLIEDININCSALVFETAAKIPTIKKIVYLSSVAAYGKVTEKNVLITEEYPVLGDKYTDFYYSYCKGRVEKILDTIAINHPELVVTRLRPHIIAGKEYFKAYRDRLFTFEQMNKKWGFPLTLLKPRNHDHPLYQLVHEQDVVDVLYLAASDINNLPDVFNLGGRPLDRAIYYKKRDVRTINFSSGSLLWKLLRQAIHFLGLFSNRWKVIYIWTPLLSHVPIMDSSKIEKVLGRSLISTEQILDEFMSK